MIEIYVDQISERLTYTLGFIFKERGVSFRINNDFQSFEKFEGQKLNYSERFFEGVPSLIPSTLLFDEAIFEYAVHKGSFYKEECLSFNRIIDPIASVFYIISRMEEYYPYVEDHHGRFSSKLSVLSKFNWLDKVVCDRWAEDVIAFIATETKEDIKLSNKKVEIIPTFDIDNTYAYKLKKGMRKWLSVSRDFIRRDKYRLIERRQVNKGEKKDPFDTFDYIEEISKRGFDVHVFWHLGDYGRFDKNISHLDIRHQSIIQHIDSITTLGLHPSYRSTIVPHALRQEKERLQFITEQKITCSRNHYLKIEIPATYHKLLREGFKQDYSLGYADNIGFRAGTARSFKWFDLDKNRVSELVIHPFTYMDGSLNEYLKLSTADAKKRIDLLYKEIASFGGKMICIWHNETIGECGKWKGWKSVLEHTLKLDK